MSRKKMQPTEAANTIFTHKDSFITEDGFEVVKGDTIKVKGEYGTRFKFWAMTTNINSGATWVDCFEVHRGQNGAFRSFRPDRIKRVPQKGKRAKRVND